MSWGLCVRRRCYAFNFTFHTIAASGLQAGDFALFDFSAGTANFSPHPDFTQAMILGVGARNERTFLPRIYLVDMFYDNTDDQSGADAASRPGSSKVPKRLV
jgi:hypothetical protein